MRLNTQQARRVSRLGFLLLFVLAPVLDLFRLDLGQGHFIILGMDWRLGLSQVAQSSPTELAGRIMVRAFLPGLLFVAIAGVLVWRYGRIYCGWLCPHFSMVEWLDGHMQRLVGQRSVWERLRGDTPPRRGLGYTVFGVTALAVALVWAFSLISYITPPRALYQDLWQGGLGDWRAIFLTAATLAFWLEFVLARHFFCKFGCALGIFQSLIWMANPKARVITFDTTRASACRDCNACDKACPMRLPPRGKKRSKFTCTQCLECVSACAHVRRHDPQGALLSWSGNTRAEPVVHVPRQPRASPARTS